MKNTVTHLEEIISEEQGNELYDFLYTGNWRFGSLSLNDPFKRSIPHWSIHFAGLKNDPTQSPDTVYYNCEEELKGIIKEIYQEVKTKILDSDDILVRCYANGQTVGLDQRLHTDDFHPESKTTIVYVNNLWNVDAGGETIIWDKDKREITHSFLPKFRSAICFSGHIWHGVRPVTAYAENLLRMTLMFKTRKEGTLEEKKIIV